MWEDGAGSVCTCTCPVHLLGSVTQACPVQLSPRCAWPVPWPPPSICSEPMGAPQWPSQWPEDQVPLQHGTLGPPGSVKSGARFCLPGTLPSDPPHGSMVALWLGRFLCHLPWTPEANGMRREERLLSYHGSDWAQQLLGGVNNSGKAGLPRCPEYLVPLASSDSGRGPQTGRH